MAKMKKFEAFNSIIGYDYDLHLWVYDCKYYLIDGAWADKDTGKKIMDLSKQDEKDIEEYEKIVRKKDDMYDKWSVL